MIEVLLLLLTLVVASGPGVAIVAAERIPLDMAEGGGGRCRAQGSRAGDVAPGAQLLVADRDREDAVHAIAMAMAEGRLTLEEGVVRIEAAVCARRHGELMALLDDLPSTCTDAH